MNFQPPLLDLSQAQDIATEASQLRELVATFEASLVSEMARLDRAFAEGDGEQVQFGLHTLKGFMALFTQAPLAQAVADLYHQSRQQSLAQSAAIYRELTPALTGLQTEVKAWLGAL